MYSEGDEVGENCKTILLKSLLLQDITAAIQRQSPGALRLPTCLILAVLKASLLLTVRQRTRMASFFYKNCIALIAFGYEERTSCNVVTYPLWYFWFWLWSGSFFLSLFFFACSPTAMHSLSLSLRAFEHPFFMLLSSQRDGDNDLNEGGWGKERNREFVW